MNLNDKKMTLILSIVVVVAGIIVVVFYFTRENDSPSGNQTNSTISATTNEQDPELEKYTFSSPNYYAEHIVSVGGKESLVMHDSSNGESRKYNEYYDYNFQYGNFAWNKDKTRLYFTSLIPDSGHLSFGYIDITDSDPLAGTSISYEDPERLIGDDVKITRAEGNLLYLTSQGEDLVMDISSGSDARPRFIR